MDNGDGKDRLEVENSATPCLVSSEQSKGTGLSPSISFSSKGPSGQMEVRSQVEKILKIGLKLGVSYEGSEEEMLGKLMEMEVRDKEEKEIRERNEVYQ
jgi:hypothetical protein